MKHIFFCLTLICSSSIQCLDDYTYYDTQYHNISQKTNQPIGVVMVAYNRPHYLKRVIESLEKNPESQTLPFYFFLEGGRHATQTENAKIITNSRIKDKTIIMRHKNYGCPKNFIDARRFMFDWCGYEKVIVFEDDIVVSPHYIQLTLNLHTWAKRNFSNVGIVSCWSHCQLNTAQKSAQLRSVQQGTPWYSFVSYCLDKNVWNDIKAIFHQYEQFFDKIPDDEKYDRARSKPVNWTKFPEMKQWLQQLINTHKVQQKKGYKFPESHMWDELQQRLKGNSFEMNQDTMNALTLWLTGYIKIQTVVNRARHIGLTDGLAGDITNTHYSHIHLDSFQQDAYITDFIVA